MTRAAPVESLSVYLFFTSPVPGHYVRTRCRPKTEVNNVSQRRQNRVTATGNMQKNLAKIGRAVPEIRSRPDTDTHRHTDMLITILRSTVYQGRSKNLMKFGHVVFEIRW